MLGRKKELKLTTHDNRKRFFLRRFWIKKRLLAAFFKTLNVAMLYKQAAVLNLDLVLFKWGGRSLYNSRCLLSGRAKAVNSTFSLSRFSFRIVSNQGFIDGLSRASW